MTPEELERERLRLLREQQQAIEFADFLSTVGTPPVNNRTAPPLVPAPSITPQGTLGGTAINSEDRNKAVRLAQALQGGDLGLDGPTPGPIREQIFRHTTDPESSPGNRGLGLSLIHISEPTRPY